MRYGPNLLEEILRRTDIVQLVGRRVKLTRRGQAFWGCCPFHGEKTASFKVENGRRTYKCFGCGKGGDAFRWLMETEGLSFPEAVEKLAGEAGVELPKWTPEDEARAEKKKSLYDVIAAAASFFESQLYEPVGRAAREYLKSRGFDEDTARRFQLGFAPAAGSALMAHLTAKNVTQDDMIAAGLVRPADEERGVRDFFFNRLMFPISDGRGRVVAFGGRGLTADAKPKYINTGETEFFQKGRLLYNFANARPAGIKAQTIIVAEGYMDVIALVRAGFEASVAPLGTALTEDQLQLLWRVAAEPVMAFDGDEAGLKAAHRAARLALPGLKPGHSVRFAFLPAGEDPDSLIRSAGPPAMQRVLDSAIPLSEVIWRTATEGKDTDTPERQAALISELNQTLQVIPIGDVRKFYLDAVAEKISETLKIITKVYDDNIVSLGAARSAAFRFKAGRQTASPVAVSTLVKSSRIATATSVGKAPTRTPTVDESDTVKVRLRAPLHPTPKNAAEGLRLLEQRQKTTGGAQRVKEAEVLRLILEQPELAGRYAELLAVLPFSDPFLDRLRHELLNVAASGFGLENKGLENHLVRHGMADLVERLKAPKARSEGAEGSALGENADARFLRAASQLRDMAELDPERRRALERYGREGTEQSWLEARRLLEGRSGE